MPRAPLLVAPLVAAALAGCVADGGFRCQANADCADPSAGDGARCEADHFCSYYDPTCTDTSQRYGAHAGSASGSCTTFMPYDCGSSCSCIAHVATGYFSTCASTTDGRAFCWGDNRYGQLGDGNAPNGSALPRQVMGLQGATAVAVGDLHACALTPAGVFCWGQNTRGQLGNGTLEPTDQAAVPVMLPAGVQPTIVAAGEDFSCAAAADGSVYCWGDDLYESLGDGGAREYSNVPIQTMPPGPQIRRVLAGGTDACVLNVDGDVWCWGFSYSPTPAKLTTPAPTASLAMSLYGICALSATDGTVACNGVGANDQPWGPGSMVAELTVGRGFGCALRTDFSVWCWGGSPHGELGVPGVASSDWPTKTPLSDVVEVSSSYQHSCARRRSGETLCWGANEHGQLGDGSMAQRDYPLAARLVCP